MWIKSRNVGGIGTVTLALLLGAGCSRPVTVPDEAVETGSTKPSRPEPADASLAHGEDNATSKLPFRERENVPAGTLISVRLNSPISITESDSENSSFEAIVVDPVVVQGDTLIPIGTTVTGRVESARISQLKPSRGYVRLALATVHAGGLDIPVQTASLFARQSPATDQSSPIVSLKKGRHLTFSLSEPVYIASSRTPADH